MGEFIIEDGVLKAYTGRAEIVEVPKEVHTIGEGAFKACVSLRKVVLPFGLQCIQDHAFKGCRLLEEVRFQTACPKWEIMPFTAVMHCGKLYCRLLWRSWGTACSCTATA